MKDLRSGIEHLKQAKAHMSKANGIMSDHISKLKAFEEENAELRDELDDWKGNAEGFQPDSDMKLPVDADGLAIRPGDRIYFNGDPEGCFGLLAARSSLCGRGLMMLNGVGIIDSGYTGEVQVPLANIGNRTQRVAAGERIAQLIIVPCELPTFRRAEALEETERGEGGFGSTGVE